MQVSVDGSLAYDMMMINDDFFSYFLEMLMM